MTIQLSLSEEKEKPKPFIKSMLIDLIWGGGGGKGALILNQLIYFWYNGMFVWKAAAVLVEIYLLDVP